MFGGHQAARQHGLTQGEVTTTREEKSERGPVMERGSPRAGGEQRCLGDDCRFSRWSKPFSLTYTPGFSKQKQGVGMEGPEGVCVGSQH